MQQHPYEATRTRQHVRRAHVHHGALIATTVRDYLEEEHTRAISLAELATLTGVSSFHLSRVFRRTMGVPPHAYLSQVRVRRACALLERGVTVSIVTHATGFFDQSHFTRTFKRIVGVPPGEYARSISPHIADRQSA
ncbi:MAG: AraC family transcriptional regulator [Gemmatimonadaceae bacterium]